jgi:hypothetical protein
VAVVWPLASVAWLALGILFTPVRDVPSKIKPVTAVGTVTVAADIISLPLALGKNCVAVAVMLNLAMWVAPSTTTMLPAAHADNVTL